MSKNEIELRAWPHVEDDVQHEKMQEALKKSYEENPLTRSVRLLEEARIRQLWPYLGRFWTALIISPREVLSYLLEPSGLLEARMPTSLSKVIDDSTRNSFCTIPLKRGSIQDMKIVTSVGELSSRKALVAYRICVAFRDILRIRTWPILRSLAETNAELSEGFNPSFWRIQETLQCRICYL